MVLVHITKKSSNVKTGPIPVTTTEESSCSPTCPFINSGCYAKSGPLALHWKKVSNGTQKNLTNWDGLCSFIKEQPENQLIRINQSGDIPHNNGAIDADLLSQLVEANKGRKAYTYTHHKMSRDNFDAVKHANNNGFTINVSTESLVKADGAIDLGLPAVTVVSSEEKTPTHTPKGRRVVVCPAQVNKGQKAVTCKTCKLCSKQRDYVIAFVAHGSQVKKVNAVLS
tara:strand:- start:61 stop:738 length:678 start_codon:yes stop_codon:yes gene_type:complete